PPSGGTPSGGTPSGGTPSGGTPSGGTPSGGTPSGGTPSGGTPTDFWSKYKWYVVGSIAIIIICCFISLGLVVVMKSDKKP
ncbi:MAG: hypothetical protein PHG66_01165, partial [Candidatus Colwellbacteria bacterium]|nr:hypothetical protein [Candidatus Colwellbacteria bacterium]